MELNKIKTTYQNVLPAFRKQNTSSSDSGADRTASCVPEKVPEYSVITTPAFRVNKASGLGAGIFPPALLSVFPSNARLRPLPQQRAGAGIYPEGGDMRI